MPVKKKRVKKTTKRFIMLGISYSYGLLNGGKVIKEIKAFGPYTEKQKDSFEDEEDEEDVFNFDHFEFVEFNGKNIPKKLNP